MNTLTKFEDLSNEIFYEIFEYIECYDLFNGFLNLNHRFQTLLNYPYLSLKVNLNFLLGTSMFNYYSQYIIPNKHRIISLRLDDRSDIIATKSSLSMIDSSFNRLESLNLNAVRHKEFISFFPILTSLPRLFSLTIHFNNSIMNLTEIYRLIFTLSFLKKIQISANGHLLTMPLPINTSTQCSYIQQLTINHSCNLNEIFVLISYTPLLTHLTCLELLKYDQEIQGNISTEMLHLKTIIFHMCTTQFNALEAFIEKICKQLQVLCINTSDDSAYLDASRWERVISKHMPYLRMFKFEYHEWYYQNIQLTPFHNLLNQFTSPFWINRGWFFQIIADIDYWPPIKIRYSIQPDKDKWHPTTNIKLTIEHLYFATGRQNLVDMWFAFISNFHITHLNVDCKKLLCSKLFKLLCILPNLKSLRISSLSFFKLTSLSQEEAESVQVWSKANTITKLVIDSYREENDLEKMQFFINLVPRIEYLKVKCEDNFNIQSIVQFILTKNIEKLLNFNLFCLWVPITNDGMIKQLQTMINLNNYKIIRTIDRIYLKWKLQ